MNTGIIVGLVILGILILISLYLIRSRRKNKIIKNQSCQHNFIHQGYINLNEHARHILRCKKCDVSIHVPVYSIKKLREIESGN